jgi:hypothetical protein
LCPSGYLLRGRTGVRQPRPGQQRASLPQAPGPSRRRTT